MTIPEQVKQSTDAVVAVTAVTINVAAINEWVTLIAGLLACLWSIIRLAEWISRKSWRDRRAQ